MTESTGAPRQGGCTGARGGLFGIITKVMNFRPMIRIMMGFGMIALLGMDYAGKPLRFPSPHGKFEVAFEPPLTEVRTDPDQPLTGPGPKSIRYRVAFYVAGTEPPIAFDDYYDIYASSPTSPANLIKGILWSPEEDFAVLPRENWPPTSDVKGRKAVSLNTSFPWEYVPLLLDDRTLVWMDSLRLVGNSKDGCRLSVAQFDGRTGKTTPIMEGENAYGYEVVGSTGNKVLMKKVLSSCATPEDTRDFTSECITLDLDFLRREMAPCPK